MEMPDIAAEKARINSDIKKLNKDRVETAWKLQTEVKVHK